MKIFFRFLMILILPTLLLARNLDYADIMSRIKQTFQESLTLYEKGEQEEAKLVAQSAYFELFENLEGPIRINVSGRKAYAMESKFVKIRKLISEGAPLGEVKALMESLSLEMDEVLPKLEKGVKLVAERSEEPHEVKESSLNSSSLAERGLDARWQALLGQIELKYAKAIEALQKGDKEEAKRLVIAAQFEDYRNGMAETAIRRHLSQIRDGQIQSEMGKIVRSINRGEEAKELKEELSRVTQQIRLALADLPAEAAELAKVKVENLPKEEQVRQDFTPTIEALRAQTQKALALYKEGKGRQAMSLVQDSYFDIFEASGMEVKIGAVDATLKTSIEGTFSQIVALMKNGSKEESVERSMEILYAQLEEGASKLQRASTPWALFIYSLIIILREGVEALIVITAVIAYLIKSGNAHRLALVYSSLWAAIALSFVTAVVMNYLFNASGESREMLEGITMLVAVLLLFYVGFWLLSNAHAKKWSQYISGKVSESLSSGSAKALWFTVFLAVYREGAETVLFYQALLFDAQGAGGYSLIALGFGVGLVVLVVLYYLLKWGAVKIPIRPFFMATSAVIFYMSVVFAGKGIMELVEGKVFEPTLIEGFPTVAWLGVYPYMESLLPQAVLLLGVILGSVYIKIQAKRA